MPNLQAQFNQALTSGSELLGIAKGVKELQETKELYKQYINKTVEDMQTADKYIKDKNITGESIQKAANQVHEIYKDKPKLRESGIDKDMMKQLMALKPEQPAQEQPKQTHPIEQRQEEIKKSKLGKSFITDTIDLYHKTRGV